VNREEPAVSWSADEAKIGQENKITRRWARHGARVAALSDQRAVSATSSEPTTPRLVKGAALILPHEGLRLDWCGQASANIVWRLVHKPD
jgi:hypothetical protein